MSGYEDYPVFLHHPKKGDSKVAANAADENKLIEAGYERPGQSNPAAFIEAQDNPVALPDHEEYPKFVKGAIVNDPSMPPPKPEGMYPKYLGGKIVTEDDEIDMIVEADEEARVPAAKRAEEREELLKDAAERGIRVDARWGIERLRNVVGKDNASAHGA